MANRNFSGSYNLISQNRKSRRPLSAVYRKTQQKCTGRYMVNILDDFLRHQRHKILSKFSVWFFFTPQENLKE